MALRGNRMECALAMGALLLACGCEPAPESNAGPGAASPAAVETANAEPAEEGSRPTESAGEVADPGVPALAAEGSPPVAAGSAEPSPPPPSVDALAQAVAGAAEAAAGTPGEGGSHCEQAYTSVIAMVQALQQQLGGGPGSLPERESFVAACNELPENVQQCMVMAYAAQHREECRRATASVDGATRDRIRRMMGDTP